jgi:hypothetical protein
MIFRRGLWRRHWLFGAAAGVLIIRRTRRRKLYSTDATEATSQPDRAVTDRPGSSGVATAGAGSLPYLDSVVIDPEASDADVLDQYRPAVPEALDVEPVAVPLEVSVIDYVDQTREVPLDDDVRVDDTPDDSASGHDGVGG